MAHSAPIAKRHDSAPGSIALKLEGIDQWQRVRQMPHGLDVPITHEYRGHNLVVKFDWNRPNDPSPTAAHVLAESGVQGLADTVAELPGPWPDYPCALADAMAAAERWIDSQLP